jgi:hypothetical protein
MRARELEREERRGRQRRVGIEVNHRNLHSTNHYLLLAQQVQSQLPVKAFHWFLFWIVLRGRARRHRHPNLRSQNLNLLVLCWAVVKLMTDLSQTLLVAYLVVVLEDESLVHHLICRH